MLRDLPKDLSRVDVECDQKLVPLFKRSFPEYNIYPRRTVRDKGHDFHSPIGAIARYLRPTYDSFTDSPARFLIPNEQDVQKWQSWLNGLGHGLKVGLCWRSGTKSVVRTRDSIGLCDYLAPVLKMEGITFINLMYGDAGDELQSVEETLGVHIHQPPQLDQFNDVDQTAALIKGMDVVVGIATSPIGLAQGVGCASVLLYTGEPGKLAPLWWPGTTYLTRAMDEGWGTVVEQLSDYLKNYPERK
jgi:ADP-heptose:LPS heptosyltransferase